MTRNSSLGEILTPRDAAQLINLDLVNLPNPPNGSIQIHNGSAPGGMHTLAGPLGMDGFTVLYKAMDQARFDCLFDLQGVLNRTEFVSFYLNVAKKYAAWAKRRDNVASVIIVQIAIQNSAIEAMRHPDLQRVSWQVRSGQSSSAIAVQ
ncbi:uncharacterized protein FOBCDRAFT_273274 [Fusarium oxysporum Fo47]|nr:uncharacterized protein FOBCDRAFT_273274 [Fusarium oxysporum Fo47]QKD53571.1 hypothetical protein FOBCDRAFT_273274 [Fusarium oxysporum Fo47]